MSNSGHKTAAISNRSWLQFSLRSLLLAMTLIGVLVGIAANYGPGMAIGFSVVSSLACFLAVGALRCWRTRVLWQRLFACVELVVCALILAIFMAVPMSPSFARANNARRLQRVLSMDQRFASIQVEYSEGKGNGLSVEGQVDSENTFAALREITASFDWHQMDDIYWHVAVVSTKRRYNGSDSELFGDESR